MSSHHCVTDGPAVWADLIRPFRGRYTQLKMSPSGVIEATGGPSRQ